MSGLDDSVSSPFWSCDLQERLTELEADEFRELEDHERREKAARTSSERASLTRERQAIQERYAEVRRRLETHQGLRLFVGD